MRIFSFRITKWESSQREWERGLRLWYDRDAGKVSRITRFSRAATRPSRFQGRDSARRCEARFVADDVIREVTRGRGHEARGLTRSTNSEAPVRRVCAGVRTRMHTIYAKRAFPNARAVNFTKNS